MRKRFKKRVLPFLLCVAIIANVIAPVLMRTSFVYAAEENASLSEPAASVVLGKGSIEINGVFFTDEEFISMLDNAEISRIPFVETDVQKSSGEDTGISTRSSAVVPGLILLGDAIVGAFTTMYIIFNLSDLNESAYKIKAYVNGKAIEFTLRFYAASLKINDVEVKEKFNSTIKVLTDYFIQYQIDHPNQETEHSIAIGLGDIAKKYGFDDIYDKNAGKCQDAAEEMAEYLKSKNEHGAAVTLTWTPDDGSFIWSDIAGKAVGNNVYHVGVLYQGNVYCNVHPGALPYDTWVSDFVKPPESIKLPPIIAEF